MKPLLIFVLFGLIFDCGEESERIEAIRMNTIPEEPPDPCVSITEEEIVHISYSSAEDYSRTSSNDQLSNTAAIIVQRVPIDVERMTYYSYEN